MMEKVLVYENDRVNEYDVVYDKEYMNVLLEEYRKSFSHLRAGSILTSGSCSKDSVKNMIRYFNDVAFFSVSSTNTLGCYEINYIGTINPVVYGLLRNSDGDFSLDNRKIHALLHWSEALEHRSEKDKKASVASFSPVNDFLGLDERVNVVENITNLLDDVTLEYAGEKKDVTISDVEMAKVVSRFVDRFNVSKSSLKQLKK